MNTPHGLPAHSRQALRLSTGALGLVLSILLGGVATADISEYEFGPSVDWGGRSVAATISPIADNVVIEAAEGGGLYESTNGGASWARIESFPMFRMSDVLFNPQDANLLIASTLWDGRSQSRSGIWRSTDGGGNWSRAAVSYSCTSKSASYGIAMADAADVSQKIFVANECGVAYSSDGGENWINDDVATQIPAKRFWDVTAIRSAPNTVTAYACGHRGVYRAIVSGDAPPTWTLRKSGFPTHWNSDVPCSIAVSPVDADVVFLTTFSCPTANNCPGGEYGMRVFESDDGGQSWEDLGGDLANNRPGFVATNVPSGAGPGEFDLYWGNGYAIFRHPCTSDGTVATLDCQIAPDTDCSDAVDNDGDGLINEGCPASGPDLLWPPGPDPENSGLVPSQCTDALDNDGDGLVNDGCQVMEHVDNGTHPDPAGIAFDSSGCAVLISNDGGIGRSVSCGANWADSNFGRYALQIYNAFGTVRGPGLTETDIYFGTQDNQWWSTLTNGLTWDTPGCCEGFNGQVDRRVPPGGLNDIRMTYSNGAPFFNFLSPRGFTTFTNQLADPPGGYTGNPVLFGHQRWAQINRNDQCPPDSQLYVMQPETGAQCGNDTDDDFDGAVNDGCPASGPPEDGIACHDNVDSDADGLVNDGCSHIYSPETGVECSDQVDNDGDGVINDGCPTFGPDAEPSASDCRQGNSGRCLNAADDDSDGFVNDGCPEVGVWGAVGPTFTEQWRAPLSPSGPATDPTFYFAVDTGSDVWELRKISGPLNAGATLENASGSGASSQIVSIGGHCGAPGTWYCPRAVGVDPNDPSRVVVADVGAGSMKRSEDGGATWFTDQELTDLVIRDGEFRWSGFGRNSPAWSIAFDPEDSDRILVGTELAGIVATVNGGSDWFTVADTYDRVPFVNSFFFDSDHDLIYVSTYGRGLWALELDNAPPVAICRDVDTATDPGVCTADVSVDDGSYDPEGGPVSLEQDPPSPYPLGTTGVILTVADEVGYTDTCEATVTVTDDEPPEVECNNPPTIAPPDAPISFTATAIDNCGVGEPSISGYDCFTYTNNGKRIDKTESCVVELFENTVTILDSGGVDDRITWSVTVTDVNGNAATATCEVLVVNPGQD